MLLKSYNKVVICFRVWKYAHEETLSEFMTLSCLEHSYQEAFFRIYDISCINCI